MVCVLIASGISFSAYAAQVETIDLFELDSDVDNLSNDEEENIGTDPRNGDTDNDDLSDYQEVNISHTDPLNSDSDGDGMSDGNEQALGFNPLDSTSPFKKIDYDTAFDWSMPDRFGLDSSGDGLIDYYSGDAEGFDLNDSKVFVNPDSWHVDFDACSLLDDDPTIIKFEWLVEGQSFEKIKCDEFSYDFPYEGIFEVTLTATNSSSSEIYTENVIVQDFLIFSFGDSYGSGEGVPDISSNGVFVASKINQIKLRDEERAKELQRIEIARGGLAEQLVNLEGELSVFLDQLGETEKNGILRCLADKVIIENTPRQINNLTKWINAEEDKRWYAGKLVKINAWKVERTALQGTLKVAQNSFANLDCTSKFEQFDELGSKVNDIRTEIANVKGSIQDLIVLRGNIIEDRIQTIQNLKNLVSMYKQNTPEWQVDQLGDDIVHRSANSGHAKAALWLEKIDPRTSVTFIHLANSGAITPDIAAQIEKANELNNQREIDAVILSIGGNDALFSSIIINCILYEPCYEDNGITKDERRICDLGIIDEDVEGLVEEISALIEPFKEDCLVFFQRDHLQGEKLAGNVFHNSNDLFHIAIYGYEDDFETVKCESYSQNCNALLSLYTDNVQGNLTNFFNPNGRENNSLERVYHVEYGDATKDENGQYCDPETNPLGPPHLISRDEYEWIHDTMMTELNKEVQRASEELGWNYVTGIFDESRNHGICSKEPWVVGMEETWFVQGDYYGMLHPNSLGYANYGYAIWNALLTDLYSDGVPRLPDHYDEPPVMLSDENSAGETKIGEHVVQPPVSPNPKVPKWVQTSAKFWVDRNVSDREFTEALGFLVKNGIIDVEIESPLTTKEQVDAEPQVPAWIGQTIEWWLDGEVSEDQFLEGIKWMIKNQIIKGV